VVAGGGFCVSHPCCFPPLYNSGEFLPPHWRMVTREFDSRMSWPVRGFRRWETFRKIPGAYDGIRAMQGPLGSWITTPLTGRFLQFSVTESAFLWSVLLILSA